MARRTLQTAVVMLLLSISISAEATITVVSHYRLGEADPGAANGVTGTDPTIDSVGAFNLARFGAPTYSSNVSLQTTTASSLSMLFNGTSDRYGSAVIPTTAIDNFGIEAWARSNGSTSGNAIVAYSGNTGASGWGIFRFGASYGFLYGGVTISAASPVTTEWTHLALVRDGGVTRFFVNGVQVLTSASVPNLPAGDTMIGGRAGAEFFDGRIDDVRIFTFNAGEFRTRDLNFAPTAVPATSPLSLAVLLCLVAVVGVVAIRRIG